MYRLKSFQHKGQTYQCDRDDLAEQCPLEQASILEQPPPGGGGGGGGGVGALLAAAMPGKFWLDRYLLIFQVHLESVRMPDNLHCGLQLEFTTS